MVRLKFGFVHPYARQRRSILEPRGKMRDEPVDENAQPMRDMPVVRVHHMRHMKGIRLRPSRFQDLDERAASFRSGPLLPRG
ncbi:hypothetical protein [Achromobacter mucicolens]|uniref:hypothetical protein n=1 Tax=Achromobacter mucicolens TaxID=1389922 RepID=UPI003D743887